MLTQNSQMVELDNNEDCNESFAYTTDAYGFWMITMTTTKIFRDTTNYGWIKSCTLALGKRFSNFCTHTHTGYVSKSLPMSISQVHCKLSMQFTTYFQCIFKTLGQRGSLLHTSPRSNKSCWQTTKERNVVKTNEEPLNQSFQIKFYLSSIYTK